MNSFARSRRIDRPERTAVVPLLVIGLRLGALALAAATVFIGDRQAQAQGKLEARYLVTLAGIPIGKGQWTVDIADGRYSAVASGATAGLMRLFTSGAGNSSAQGTIIGGAPAEANFNAKITAGKKTEEFQVKVSGGDVKDFSVAPPPPPDAQRVPLTEAHRRGISDPMTASLIRVPGNSNLIGPEACQRTVSVFDGRMRFDVQLAFKRVDLVSADKGYAGPAAVCAATFIPLAGHNPERAAVKYLVTLRELEVWLAPIAGTRIVVPIRVAIPTPIGLGILHATEFESVALPAQTTAATAKAQ
jgi:hypothetical protein